MDKRSDEERLVSDIENQLDDFFGDDETLSTEKTTGNSPAPNPLEQLKSVVLSIDWEITDDCLADLEESVAALMDTYRDDQYTHAMLRMLNSLGKYIKKRKAQAHPEAIKRVMSVFKSLEEVVSSGKISEKRKKSIVAAEIRKFKQLKQQVESKRRGRAAESSKTPGGQGLGTDVLNEIEKAVAKATSSLAKELEALKLKVREIEAELKQFQKV